MHAPDQFLTRAGSTEGNSSPPYTQTYKPPLIYKNKHINTLVQTRIPFRDQPFDGKNQQSVVLLPFVGGKWA